MSQGQDRVNLITCQTCRIRALLKACVERSNQVKTRKYASIILIFQNADCFKVLLVLRRSSNREVRLIGLLADRSPTAHVEAFVLVMGAHFAPKDGEDETRGERAFVTRASMATAIAPLAGSRIECAIMGRNNNLEDT